MVLEVDVEQRQVSISGEILNSLSCWSVGERQAMMSSDLILCCLPECLHDPAGLVREGGHAVSDSVLGVGAAGRTETRGSSQQSSLGPLSPLAWTWLQSRENVLVGHQTFPALRVTTESPGLKVSTCQLYGRSPPECRTLSDFENLLGIVGWHPASDNSMANIHRFSEVFLLDILADSFPTNG